MFVTKRRDILVLSEIWMTSAIGGENGRRPARQPARGAFRSWAPSPSVTACHRIATGLSHVVIRHWTVDSHWTDLHRYRSVTQSYQTVTCRHVTVTTPPPPPPAPECHKTVTELSQNCHHTAKKWTSSLSSSRHWTANASRSTLA